MADGSYAVSGRGDVFTARAQSVRIARGRRTKSGFSKMPTKRNQKNSGFRFLFVGGKKNARAESGYPDK